MTTVTPPALRRVSHYLIEEKLGAGGMGTVFRALDEKLGRRVALKFPLPGVIPGPEARERFIAEARAASSLDHPNICTIFDIDSTEDGETFIVMPFYEGETLDQVIARGPLPFDRAIGIAMQIARGLAAAHEELIIHRDIKPQNIVVTPREAVKILDFGLAKLATGRVTRPGQVIGTPAYMSPEHLRGEPLDPRADIWAVGVVLYEMLAGHTPFPSERIESIIHSVLSEPHVQLSLVRSDLPALVDTIVDRALAKDPRLRYERIEQMIADLGTLQSDGDTMAMTVRRAAASRKTSIAVLPFADMTAGRDQGYLCDGIAEEILAALRRIPDLYVASRTSAFQFREYGADVREIGSKLHVDHVLEGSVRRSGDRVRIAAQLINVADGYRLWYERYDREIRDIFAVEDEIADNIAAALEVTLGSERAKPAGPMSSSEAEAYEAYLQGREFSHQLRRKAFEIALQSFRRAIEVEPRYARAYAGIAYCNACLRLYFGAGIETVAAAEEASRKAVEIDPELADARAARGLALFLTGASEDAERELHRAIELDPMLYDAHYIYGRVAFGQGRVAEAAAHFREACRIVPEAYDSWYFLGMCYRRLGEPEKAHGAAVACIEAARKRLRAHPDDTRALTMGAAIFAELGEPERAEKWVRRATAIDPDEPIIEYNAACVYTALGRIDEAISCLAVSVGQGALAKSWVENDPDLDPLRADPRFQALLARA
jgi:TolB-like protein/Flp pilus assembly protein TadD